MITTNGGSLRQMNEESSIEQLPLEKQFEYQRLCSDFSKISSEQKDEYYNLVLKNFFLQQALLQEVLYDNLGIDRTH